MYSLVQGAQQTDAGPMSREEGSEELRATSKLCSPSDYSELLTNKFKELPNQVEDPFEYSRNGSEPGILIIFNQKDFGFSYPKRSGTDADVRELLRSFGRIGFNIQQKYIFEDLDRNEIIENINSIAADKELDNVNCLVVVILTHGKSEDMLVTKNGLIHVNEITSKLCSSEYFTGKPKLFLIQACKGDKKTNVSDQEPGVKSDLVPKRTFSGLLHDDTVIVYSTVEGNVAWRDPLEGSWLIQEFCRNLNAYGRVEDVLSIITRTIKCISNSYHVQENENEIYKQMPVFVSTLKKDFYLIRSSSRNFLLLQLERSSNNLIQVEKLLEKLK